ncbi:hypothetical protein Lal_00036573 [Lupinus albus]|nr:hypothetical protein Lal_00036573 [Lupinus albus]
MTNPSLSFRFAFFLSLSLTTSSSRYTSSSFSTPKATPSDLLSLLSSNSHSSRVNPIIARELNSCFKFLVPFSPNLNHSPRKLTSVNLTAPIYNYDMINDFIWWPPESVLELARLAVDSGGDPAAIQRLLDPTIITVPDVEGSKEHRCELTRTPYGRRFIHEELNLYLKFLFELIVARGPSVGLDVSLNRFDLFHGHLFLAVDSGRLGSNVTYDDSMNLRNILWLAPLPGNSAKSWVAPVGVENLIFWWMGNMILILQRPSPVSTLHSRQFLIVVTCRVLLHITNELMRLLHSSMGNCYTLVFLASTVRLLFNDHEVTGSNLGHSLSGCRGTSLARFKEGFLLVAWEHCYVFPSLNPGVLGVLVVLDARPDGIIYRDLIPDYVNVARTIYEEDLGETVVDVNYLNIGSKTSDYQIFLC